MISTTLEIGSFSSFFEASSFWRVSRLGFMHIFFLVDRQVPFLCHPASDTFVATRGFERKVMTPSEPEKVLSVASLIVETNKLRVFNVVKIVIFAEVFLS